MNRIISERKAATILVVMFAAGVVFHIVALLGFVPRDMLWGGRLKTAEEFYVFEAVSFTLNAAMLFFAVVRAKMVQVSLSARFLRIVFVVMFLLFAANTVGNLMAVNIWERIIFTPVTLIASLLSLRLASFNN